MSLEDYDNDNFTTKRNTFTSRPHEQPQGSTTAIDVKTMVKRFDKPYKASKNNKHLKKTFTAYQ